MSLQRERKTSVNALDFWTNCISICFKAFLINNDLFHNHSYYNKVIRQQIKNYMTLSTKLISLFPISYFLWIKKKLFFIISGQWASRTFSIIFYKYGFNLVYLHSRCSVHCCACCWLWMIFFSSSTIRYCCFCNNNNNFAVTAFIVLSKK